MLPTILGRVYDSVLKTYIAYYVAIMGNILLPSNWVVRYITFAKLSATCVRGFRFTATVLTPGETPCALVVSTRSLVLLP